MNQPTQKRHQGEKIQKILSLPFPLSYPYFLITNILLFVSCFLLGNFLLFHLVERIGTEPTDRLETEYYSAWNGQGRELGPITTVRKNFKIKTTDKDSFVSRIPPIIDSQGRSIIRWQYYIPRGAIDLYMKIGIGMFFTGIFLLLLRKWLFFSYEKAQGQK